MIGSAQMEHGLRCRVCTTASAQPFMNVDERRYERCSLCLATQLAAAQLPDARAELAHYQLHENDPADPHYRQFLARLAGPLLEVLDAGARGLDYGCGPGPALAAMLGEAGHDVALYDPFFHRDERVLDHRYDFITLSEVAEHLHEPGRTFSRLTGLLNPGGWLAVMTSFQTEDARFADWHYRRDPTHVVFYREQTMARLADRLGLSLLLPAPNIALLRSQANPSAPGDPDRGARASGWQHRLPSAS